jgi:serine/threonine-protein kinase RsbW
MVEESTVSLSSEGLSVHMRIPAERGYLGNAVLTLRGICEHVAVSLDRSNRIILALEEALMNAMEHAYKDVPEEQGGFIDLQFAVEGSELSLIVEDYGCGLPEGAKKPLSTEDEILCDRGRGLNILDEIPDKILVDSARGRGTRTSMLFYLVSCD